MDIDEYEYVVMRETQPGFDDQLWFGPILGGGDCDLCHAWIRKHADNGFSIEGLYVARRLVVSWEKV